MKKFVSPFRIVFIIVALALILSVYGGTLYNLQMLSDSDSVDETVATTSNTITIAAARGSILDRNGEVLAYDEVSYNITLSRSDLLDSDDPNAIVLQIINTAKAAGVSYTDTLPLSSTSPFTYTDDMTDAQSERLSDYLAYFNLDPDISASDLFVWLKDHYDISYTISLTDARLIIGVRYELELRAVTNISPYVFVENADVSFITQLLEQNFSCVNVESTTTRKYNTTYAAQVLGYTGLMTAEEYEDAYEADGYPMDATVGKSGVELAFEQYLHPASGTITVTKNADGEVIGVTVDPSASAGKNVYISLDIGLQGVAEEALSSTIASINASRTADQELATGGAVVVTDVNTGEILGCASCPSYNPSTFYNDYADLLNDKNTPLLNRATNGLYNPGSTFKMVTAYAGLSTGTISSSTTIYDEGIYTRYPDYQPKCWIYPDSHGYVNVDKGLAVSCNYFFFWLGDTLGIRAIDSAASLFGLDASTGIEIGDSSGIVATPEYKADTLKEDWYAADTLQAAIGQSYNMFTPIELANYVAAIANGGTLNKATLLSKVVSSDYAETVFQNARQMLSTIDNSNGYINILQDGMKGVVSYGTAMDAFTGFDTVSVAAKTGTVQSDTTKMNTAVFVCYAPVDDPQIAISIVVEKGGSGSSLINIAKEILSYYFNSTDYATVKAEDTLNQ